MFQNGFSLSVEKTIFVIFGPWHPVSPEFSIIINGQRLYAAKQVKYLGVTFQWSGSVSKHVHSNIQSALRATNLVKLLSRMPWANQPKTMITLVKSLVRSRLYYGLEACYDMPASLITAIEQAECRAIKLALGLPRATARYLAYREAGMLPAKLYLQFICSKYQFRSQTTDNSTGVEVLATSGARPLPGSAFPSATSARTWSGRRGWRGNGQPGDRSTRTRLGSWRERGLSWR